MSTLITKPPVGLLDLVGTKAQGQNPSQFSELAYLSIEGLYPFSLSRMTVENTAPAGMPASPSLVSTHTVPNGETWIVFSYALTIQVAIGEAFSSLRAVIYGPAGALITAITAASSGPSTAVGIGAAVQYATVGLADNPPCPFWLPSGYQLGYFCGAVTGAPTVISNAWVTKLQT